MDNTNYYWGATEDEQARVAFYMQLFSQRRIRRTNFELQWQEAAALVWPEYRDTFAFGHVLTPGVKKTQLQVDSAGAIASHRFAAICDYVLTPAGMPWIKGEPSDKNLLKDKATRQWFDDANRISWEERYSYPANFLGQNKVNWQCLGVFGNHGMYVTERQSALHGIGLSYRSEFSGIYLLQNEQGIVDGFIRHFRRDARQAYQKWGDKIPPILKAALAQESSQLYNFFEIVHPRNDWMPWEILSPKGKPYVSCYLSVEGYCILEEGGYRCLPLNYGRYMVAPEEEYGRGPAQMVLPALKTSNSIAGDFLKTSHAKASPAYLIGDDGMVDFKYHSNAINYGGVNPDGKIMVGMVPVGDPVAAEEALKVQRQYIDDAFLVALFADLLDDAKRNVQLSARQVVERAVEKSMFMSPLGSETTEYLGPMFAREWDILSAQGKFPKMTPAMKEAGGEYEITFTSFMGRNAKVQEAAATMQFVEAAGMLAQTTGDPTVMDAIEANEALNIIAQGGGVPEKVLATMESRANKAKQRAQAQEREQQAKEMPARAAIIKAQAIAQKAQAGQNIGGTLSGVPQSQMPEVPGGP